MRQDTFAQLKVGDVVQTLKDRDFIQLHQARGFVPAGTRGRVTYVAIGGEGIEMEPRASMKRVWILWNKGRGDRHSTTQHNCLEFIWADQTSDISPAKRKRG
ncbi:MAG: hypothetical protein A2666_02680 [Parcubacteria group bacterium RIFCSPHIGHO2_01_FULL_47_10b]|nr:MAG: hypothetical protein A2666_02680 [Parcubacteria group bacterium RIFCSPHIGHO2_01_FULL_47_10b]